MGIFKSLCGQQIQPNIRAHFGFFALILAAVSTPVFASGQAAPKDQDSKQHVVDAQANAESDAVAATNSAAGQQLFDWVLTKAQDLKVDHIANVKLNELRENVRGVHYAVIAGIIFGASGGHRSASVTQAKDRTVLISEVMFQQMSQQGQTLLFLHGGLEAAGYDDEQYEISLALWYLAYAPDAADFANRLETLFANRSFDFDSSEKYYAPDSVDAMTGRSSNAEFGVRAPRGNGSVAGSGGDGFEIALKEKMLLQSAAAVKNMNSASPEANLAVLQTAVLFFKPNISQDLADNSIRLKYLENERRFSLHTSIQVAINPDLAASHALEQMISELALR